MRKIAEVFRTIPITALDVETALPPTNIRLDHLQRKYALQLLLVPNSHPVLQLCLDTWPATAEYNQDETEYKRKWNDTQGTHQHHNRRQGILATSNQLIQPHARIETIDTLTCPAWQQNNIDIKIDKGTKTQAANLHTIQMEAHSSNTKILRFYSDGSLLNRVALDRQQQR